MYLSSEHPLDTLLDAIIAVSEMLSQGSFRGVGVGGMGVGDTFAYCNTRVSLLSYKLVGTNLVDIAPPIAPPIHCPPIKFGHYPFTSLPEHNHETNAVC